jgi:uncharacterized protein with LGFP repeats
MPINRNEPIEQRLSRLSGASEVAGPLSGASKEAQPILPPFNEKYEQLGGAGGVLGAPQGDPAWDPAGGGQWVASYEHGALCGSGTDVFEMHGAIYGKWRELRDGGDFLGWPVTDESATPDGVGRYNHFGNRTLTGASIYCSARTGAHAVNGAIRERWSELGWEGGVLGYPVGDETDNPDNPHTHGTARYSRFEHGFISWSPDSGAHEHGDGSEYLLTVDHMFINTTRSGSALGNSSDTDVLALTVNVGDQQREPEFHALGDFKDGGPYPVGASLKFTADDPTALVFATWSIVNNADGDTKELREKMRSGFTELASAVGAAGGAAIGAGIGGIAGPVGAAAGAAVGALGAYLAHAGWPNCDGPVAKDAMHICAATLNDQTAPGPHENSKDYPGIDSPAGCGGNSSYNVTWRLERA